MHSITSVKTHVVINQQVFDMDEHCSIAADSISSNSSAHVGLEMQTLSANIWFEELSGAGRTVFK